MATNRLSNVISMQDSGELSYCACQWKHADGSTSEQHALSSNFRAGHVHIQAAQPHHTCRDAQIQPCQDHWRSSPLSILLCALEPPLVTNLNLEDVQGAIADCCCDQLVPAALIAISCSPDRVLSVRGQAPLEQRGACPSAADKAAEYAKRSKEAST